MVQEVVYQEVDANREFVPRTFALTKALFKEGNEKEAIAFFKEELAKFKTQV